MKFKPDWDESKARLTALWNGEELDRPCLFMTAGSGKNIKVPPPRDAEARWLDPDYVIPAGIASIENQWWGGEAVPSFLLMAGWLESFGAQPHFDAKTIWFDPVAAVDFDSPPDFRLDPANPWIRRFEELYVRCAEAAGADDFLVGQPAMLPASDILAAHLGNDRYLEAMALHPEWIDLALRQMTGELLAARVRLQKRISQTHAYWYGNAGRMVHVEVQPDQVKPLMNALDPALLLLHTWVANPEAGRQMLAELPRKVRATKIQLTTKG